MVKNIITLISIILFSRSVFSAELPNKGFSFLGVELEKTSFKEVKDLFGEGDIYQKLHADNSLTWMCYKNKKSMKVEFGSAEMASSAINEIIMSPPPSRRKSGNCKDSNKIDSKAKFDNGIGLGSEKEFIIKTLGSPKEEKGNKILYSFATSVKNGVPDQFTVEIKLDKKSRASNITVLKTTTK